MPKRRPVALSLQQRLSAQARERERRALELRTAGYSFAAIGRRLRVSRQAAYLMVTRARARELEQHAQ